MTRMLLYDTRRPFPASHVLPHQTTPYQHWATKTMSVVRALEGHGGCVNSVEFNEDGTLLITGSDDTLIGLHSTRSWATKALIPTAHVANIFSAVPVPGSNDSQFLSCGLDGKVCITLTADGSPLTEARRGGSAAAAASDDDGAEGSAEIRNAIRREIFDTHTRRYINSRVIFMPGDPQSAYVACGNGSVMIVDVRSRKRVLDVYPAGEMASSCNGIAASPVHPHLLAAGTDMSDIYFLDVRYATKHPRHGAFLTVGSPKCVRSEGVGGINFSASGDRLVASYKSSDVFSFRWTEAAAMSSRAKMDPTDVRLEPNHDRFSQTALCRTRRYRGRLNRQTMFKEATFFMDDAVVVTGGDCGHLYFWDADTSELLHKVRGDSDIVNGVVTHEGLNCVAACGIDSTAKVLMPGQPGRTTESPGLFHPRRARFGGSFGDSDDENEDEEETATPQTTPGSAGRPSAAQLPHFTDSGSDVSVEDGDSELSDNSDVPWALLAAASEQARLLQEDPGDDGDAPGLFVPQLLLLRARLLAARGTQGSDGDTDDDREALGDTALDFAHQLRDAVGSDDSDADDMVARLAAGGGKGDTTADEDDEAGEDEDHDEEESEDAVVVPAQPPRRKTSRPSSKASDSAAHSAAAELHFDPMAMEQPDEDAEEEPPRRGRRLEKSDPASADEDDEAGDEDDEDEDHEEGSDEGSDASLPSGISELLLQEIAAARRAGHEISDNDEDEDEDDEDEDGSVDDEEEQQWIDQNEVVEALLAGAAQYARQLRDARRIGVERGWLTPSAGTSRVVYPSHRTLPAPARRTPRDKLLWSVLTSLADICYFALDGRRPLCLTRLQAARWREQFTAAALGRAEMALATGDVDGALAALASARHQVPETLQPLAAMVAMLLAAGGTSRLLTNELAEELRAAVDAEKGTADERREATRVLQEVETAEARDSNTARGGFSGALEALLARALAGSPDPAEESSQDAAS